MLFNSPEFLFLFLPITLWVYHRACLAGHKRLSGAWLVAASLTFYGWWEPKYLVLIMGSMALNHLLAIVLERCPDTRSRVRWWLLAIGVFGNLAAIGWYKYSGFFLSVSNDAFGTDFHIRTLILPLAISFFTFQQIAYLVEVYRRSHGAGDTGTYLLFVTFFPQLIAGPIVNYRDMAPQFARLGRGLVSSHMLQGLLVFSVGLFKKVIIADGVAPYSDTVFALAASGVEPTLLEAWAGALAYSLQLYFDFSGYSDMALGLGCMLGIRLPKNFESPYRASSIIEFWRRWHISLSTFLRDYLYVPLGGSQRGSTRTLINLMIVMVLGGLWHGAGWTFIAWGALHGAYLLVNHLWRRRRSKQQLGQISDQANDNTRHSVGARLRALLGLAVAHSVTLVAVVVAWVLFRASTLSEAGRIVGGMFGLNGVALPSSWQYKSPELVGALQRLGITFKELPDLGPQFPLIADVLRLLNVGQALNAAGTLTALLSLSIPIFIVFLMPNTGRIMNARLTPKVVWIATPVCAVLAAYGAFGGSGTSQFLYFNF